MKIGRKDIDELVKGSEVENAYWKVRCEAAEALVMYLSADVKLIREQPIELGGLWDAWVESKNVRNTEEDKV